MSVVGALLPSWTASRTTLPFPSTPLRLHPLSALNALPPPPYHILVGAPRYRTSGPSPSLLKLGRGWSQCTVSPVFQVMVSLNPDATLGCVLLHPVSGTPFTSASFFELRTPTHTHTRQRMYPTDPRLASEESHISIRRPDGFPQLRVHQIPPIPRPHFASSSIGWVRAPFI